MTEREEFELKTKHPEQIDFKLLISRYTRYWRLFVAGVVLCLALAFLYLAIATPQYLISSSLRIRDLNRDPDYQSGSPGFRRLDVFTENTTIEDEIEALRSVSLMERVLSDLSLQTSYYIKTPLRDREIYGAQVPVSVRIEALQPVAYKSKLIIHIRDSTKYEIEDNGKNTGYRFGQKIVTSYGTFTIVTNPTGFVQGRPVQEKIQIAFHDIGDLAIYYNKELTVVQIGEASSVLNISLLDPLPQKGKDIINKLVELYNEQERQDRNRLALQTLEFIDKRLGDLTADLAGQERTVEEFRRKNQVTDVRSDASAYLEESRQYNRELSDLNIQIDVLASLESYLSQPKQQYNLVPSNLTIDDAALLNLINEFNELQLTRERLLRTTQSGNPLEVNLKEQITNVRRDILENLQVIRKGLLVRRGNVAQKAQSFRGKIGQVPAIERELNDINRDLGVKQDLYTFLLQKREESALSLAAVSANTRLIDPAIASQKPVKPSKPVVLLLALVAGMGLPFAFVFVRDLLDNTIKQRKDVEQITYTPILGEISHNTKRSLLAFSATHATPLTEQFRLLQSNLAYCLSDHQKVILITSGMSGEGKTFFSINLGLSLSMSGSKVALLNFDYRNPAGVQELGPASDKGISDYLSSGDMALDQILKPSPLAAGLYVAGTGSVPANPAQLLRSPAVGQLISQLKEKFDFVILDTAPVGQVADAFSLSAYADVALYIIRYNYTPKALLSTIDNIYLGKKFKQPMIVLNDARKDNSYAVAYGNLSKK